MLRVQLFLIAVIVFSTSTAFGQQLSGLGMLATGTSSRTRLGGDSIHLGDMMYITVFQPARSRGMYISAHMQYLDKNQGWLPIPTTATVLGNAYRSRKYRGVRDY